MNYDCRFCRKPLAIPFPEDIKLRSMVSILAKRACCNRCADYQRRRRDLVETLQSVALQLTIERDNEKRSAVKQTIKTLCTKIVEHGENHYLISGLAQHVGEFAESVYDHPDKAAFQAEVFERGLKGMKTA